MRMIADFVVALAICIDLMALGAAIEMRRRNEKPKATCLAVLALFCLALNCIHFLFRQAVP